jgi:Ribonuclease I
MNASQYFRTIINHADKLKIPDELTSQETQSIQANVLRNKMLRMNSGLVSQSIEFNCMQTRGGSLLTEIKICYKNNGQYKSCPTTIVGNCPATFIIKGSF